MERFGNSHKVRKQINSTPMTLQIQKSQNEMHKNSQKQNPRLCCQYKKSKEESEENDTCGYFLGRLRLHLLVKSSSFPWCVTLVWVLHMAWVSFIPMMTDISSFFFVALKITSLCVESSLKKTKTFEKEINGAVHLSCSFVYHQSLRQCLARGVSSKTVYWLNEQIKNEQVSQHTY